MYLIKTFRDSLYEYEFSFPYENRPYGNAMCFSDLSTTRQVLANVQTNCSTVQLFRSILADMSEVGPFQVSRLNGHQVIDKLSQMLVVGRVKLYRRELMFSSFQERKPIVVAKSQAPATSLGWVEVLVVWDDTDQPVPNLQLVVVSPDGQRNVKQTDSDGRLRIDPIVDGICEVRCSTIGVKLEECVNFVCEGQKQAAGQGSTTQPSSTTTQTSNPLAIALIEAHKVKTGEMLASVAATAGITWQDLAYFNWGTKVPEEINKHLANDVGCTKKTADGKNYMFDDSDNPGIINVPNQPFYKAGTGIKHTMRVARVITKSDKIAVDFVEIADVHFHHNCALPHLDEKGELISELASAFHYAKDHTDRELIVHGHADRSGPPDYNFRISKRRAEAIKALLENDTDLWKGVVSSDNTDQKLETEDYQQTIKSLSTKYGWPCDPGAVDNKFGPQTESAVKSFQSE
jgi:outer membrane protein OmpA-like peptidoglycan-associated protein